MSGLHEPNFYSELNTTLSREQIAGLYGALGWKIRKCNWTDFEVAGPWCELVIEGELPVLMHGMLVDATAHAEELIAPVRAAGIPFRAEFYTQSPDRDLLFELRG